MDRRIVIVESAGGVALLEEQGDGWSRLGVAPEGRWPVWHAGTGRVAFSVVKMEGGEVRSTVEVRDEAGLAMTTAHVTPNGVSPVIALRVPHYLLWSPDGVTLSFVAAAPGGLTLFLSDARGAYSSDAAVSGAPLFPAWADAGDWIAVHSGGELVLYEPGTRVRRTVTGEAIGFRTPAWIGRAVHYCRPAADGVSVEAHDVDTREERQLLTVAGGAALARRPGSDDLSVAVSNEPDTGVFDSLKLLDTADAGARPRTVARGPFVAAFWAPSGERVAIVVPTQIGDGRYAIHFRDAGGALICASEGFYPGQDYRTLLGFFDQYALSHRLWSPGSDAFLSWGRAPGDGIASSFSDPVDDAAFLHTAQRGEPAERLGYADAAFFA